MALNLNTDLALINTTTNAGTITLPLSTSIPGRVITFKDITATFGRNTLTLNTTSPDTFEDGSVSKVLRESGGIIQLVGTSNKWFVLAGTQQNTLNISSLLAISISTNTISSMNASVSTINFQNNVNSTLSLYQTSTLLYFNSNVFAGSKVLPGTVLNSYATSLIFNPNSITNLSYWFDASVSSSMVVDSASTILTWYSISTVTTVPRNITNVLTMTGPTTSNRGLYAPNSLNGLGGVNLSTSFLTTANITNQAQNYYYFNNRNNSSEFTNICLINRLFTGTPAGNPVIHTIQMGGNVRVTLAAGGGEGFILADFIGSQNLVGLNALCNTPSIFLTSRNGGTSLARLNGVSLSSNFTSFQFSQSNFQFMFGTNTYNQFYSGNLHEYIQYRRALSTDEILRLEGYIAWKWNVMTSLPSTHPFRYTPPY